MSETINVKEFRLEDIPLSCTWIIIGPPESGKSTLIENLMYYHKHRYPVARAFIGNEDGYLKMCNIMHPLYISNYWSEEEEKNHILRQRTCVLEEHSCPYAINIIDDASDDSKIYRTPLVKGIFRIGSQHWAQLGILGTQYIIDFPPAIRNSVSYVALFRQTEESERLKLYRNCGGIAGSYANFCDLMDQLTGDFTCLIFKKRSQSNEKEDCIFYYRTEKLKTWRFGCKEYNEWAKARYNTKYKEEILLS